MGGPHVSVTPASAGVAKGRKVAHRPRSEEPQAHTDSTRPFFKDREALEAFDNTAKHSTINPSDYDAVFYPGGHGPLWASRAAMRVSRGV